MLGECQGIRLSHLQFVKVAYLNRGKKPGGQKAWWKKSLVEKSYKLVQGWVNFKYIFIYICIYFKNFI